MVSGGYLSEKELAVFGVTRKRLDNNRLVYTVPCDVCGEPLEISRFNTDNFYTCKTCKLESDKLRNKIVEMAQWRHRDLSGYKIDINYESFHRFENAVKKFDKSYAEDIEKAREYANVFDSIPEVIACIELLHIGAKVIPHQKVGRYTVDFCLPKEKLVVEIDGTLYHKDEKKMYWRDCVIKDTLGEGWEVKHVPAESVVKRHKFFGKSMKRLLDDRRFEVRKRRTHLQ